MPATPAGGTSRLTAITGNRSASPYGTGRLVRQLRPPAHAYSAVPQKESTAARHNYVMAPHFVRLPPTACEIPPSKLIRISTTNAQESPSEQLEVSVPRCSNCSLKLVSSGCLSPNVPVTVFRARPVLCSRLPGWQYCFTQGPIHMTLKSKTGFCSSLEGKGNKDIVSYLSPRDQRDVL